MKHSKRILGRIWQNEDLLLQALTHSSYGNYHRCPHNERLEFLGDSVIDLLCAELLMHHYLNEREGFMSQRRAELVCAPALALRARVMGVPKMLRVGLGQEKLRTVQGVLADTVEAICGAAFLDGGLDGARELALVNKIVR